MKSYKLLENLKLNKKEMTNITTIPHQIIKSHVEEFINSYEISDELSKNQHIIFEKYINHLILSIYGNDPNASFEDMETETAFGIDGIAIFVSDKIMTSIEDVDHVLSEAKKIDVSFFFTQSKTSSRFDRQEISDFFVAIRRFFNFEKCQILELKNFWDIAKYIYSKSSKLKKSPELNMIFASLSPTDINLSDENMKSTINMGIQDLTELNLFGEISKPQFIGIKQIMALYEKINSALEISINMAKPPIPYPKDPEGKINNAYYGLIKIDEFMKLLTEQIGNKRVLRKGIFDNNIRYYLGSSEKIEVNQKMKAQLSSKQNFLFGLLNNGVTVIGDEVRLNSEDLTLINYQIVNGCQTSHVIFEVLNEIESKDVNSSDIYLPIRFIATEDEDTKNAIIKANNSQTQLKAEQLVALSPIQKALEQYYQTKKSQNNFDLYYERRTEQYREDNIPKTKIITIPCQIKSISALFLDLPHAVSGQYGKVEKSTRGKLFQDSTDLLFLNSYYVSGLSWYKVERFVLNNEEGKKYKRARWHIIMLIKYLSCSIDKIDLKIGKISERQSKIIEKILLDDKKLNIMLKTVIKIIEECFNNNSSILSDRKLFEKKETTSKLIEFVKEYQKKNGVFK